MSLVPFEERTHLPPIETFLEDIGHYAGEGQLNYIASAYFEYFTTINLSPQMAARFESGMRTALDVCTKGGRLDAISSFMENEVLPAPVKRKLMPAALRAMRVCMRKNDCESIARFLRVPNLGERMCSKGVSYLVAARMFGSIRQLLREGCLPEGAKAKAQRACLKQERKAKGNPLATYSGVFPKMQRPKAARPATAAHIFRIKRNG
jgi:hypothetical protein